MGDKFLMKKGLVFLIFLVLSSSLIFAEEENITDQEYSRLCLESSKDLMFELQQGGFNVLRVNDTLIDAQLIYNSQVSLERRGGSGKYDSVISSCELISSLSELAFRSIDDLKALNDFYLDTAEEGVIFDSVEVLIGKIEQEISNERYEKIEALIEETYEEISNSQEEYSRMNRFYVATTQNFLSFLRENLYAFLIFIGIISLAYISYHTRIKKYLLKRKLINLRLRKKSLKELIGQTQKDYFQTGNISDSDYQVRSKNFAELIRDIDRQVPLLEESLIKSKKKDNTNEKFKRAVQKKNKNTKK